MGQTAHFDVTLTYCRRNDSQSTGSHKAKLYSLKPVTHSFTVICRSFTIHTI